MSAPPFATGPSCAGRDRGLHASALDPDRARALIPPTPRQPIAGSLPVPGKSRARASDAQANRCGTCGLFIPGQARHERVKSLYLLCLRVRANPHLAFPRRAFSLKKTRFLLRKTDANFYLCALIQKNERNIVCVCGGV